MKSNYYFETITTFGAAVDILVHTSTVQVSLQQLLQKHNLTSTFIAKRNTKPHILQHV